MAPSDPKPEVAAAAEPAHPRHPFPRHRFQLELCLVGDPGQRQAVLRGEHGDPHQFLGCHPACVGGVDGVVVRALQPTAHRAEVLLEAPLPRAKAGDIAAEEASAEEASSQTELPMSPIGTGLFSAWLPGGEPGLAYRLRFHFDGGGTWERHDPYRFPPTLGDEDLYFFSEGTHQRLWQCLGARPRTVDGVDGYGFAVWAPNARRVSVIGDFCSWDGRLLPMRRLGASGLWELFVPGVEAGALYKYEILGPAGIRTKADPMASWAEVPPNTASRTYASDYAWQDQEYMRRAESRDVRREPMAIYEMHLGSWLHGGPAAGGATDGEGAALGYRQLAPRVVEHVQELGFDYVELMPVAEHPYSGSWGYQITGYFAPTSRYGSPDDFRYFVDYLHRHGIGVILDWVPAHFVKDAHGLGRFDGTALYEHEDPRRGEHPDWGTYIFNYGRTEVRNFLVANALYWLDEFHVDGLRVDAVASMLYLDYSRDEGEWLPNHQGGRENFDAIALLREVNRRVTELYPGRFTVAEESTSWPGITKSPDRGGLGFTFKWNMGWMHDTLGYFGQDPLYRSHHHDKLTFAMVYEHSEAFVNPLSHDEVVHGKGSLLARMPGDPWRKLANLRTLFVYLYTRPGKVLLFMGSELAQQREWNHETGLDWFLRDEPGHAAFEHFVSELGRLYGNLAPTWRLDHEPEGFEWICCHDRGRSVVAYARYDEADGNAETAADDRASQGPEGAELDGPADTLDRTRPHVVVVLNSTPVPRESYRIGAPRAGRYRLLLCSDDPAFGGSGYPVPQVVDTEDAACDGFDQSLLLVLAPLSGSIYAPVEEGAD